MSERADVLFECISISTDDIKRLQEWDAEHRAARQEFERSLNMPEHLFANPSSADYDATSDHRTQRTK